MSDGQPGVAPPWWRRRWTLLFAAAGLAVVLRNLVDLAGSPPGLYVDEASIGYNAWTIAHHGVDEHGATWPLFFRAFGEYKNPVYIYALAPFVTVLGLSPAVVRLPAALFGIATVVALAGFARQVTGSRLVALAVMLLAGATPWLTLESRVGFEVISLVACLAVMLWCLSHVGGADDRRWFLLAGVAAGLGVFAYSVGRLEVALLVMASAARFCRSRRQLVSWLGFATPVMVAYLVLGSWALRHPGALTGRLSLISIGADNPPLGTLVSRFAGNMLSYLGPDFLILRGDANPRHNTGFAGMLLITSLPLLITGLVVCAMRFRQPLAGFMLAGFLLGPVSAALTAEGVPHALRDATSLPFLLGIMVYGMNGLMLALRHRPWWLLALATALAAEAVFYNVDLFGDYTKRAALYFDQPEINAIAAAHDQASGHMVWLSARLEQPYIEAVFLTLPAPPGNDAGSSSVGIELGEAGFANLRDAGLDGRQPQTGDLLVLDAGEPPPSGGTQVFTETVNVDQQTSAGRQRVEVVAVRVWRMS